MRVAVVTNTPAPYRKGFFRELSKEVIGELTVFYCTFRERNRSWGVHLGEGYSYRVLPGLTLGLTAHINPTIPIELWRGHYDIVVLGGYSYPTALIALLSARLSRRRVGLWLDGPPGGKLLSVKRQVFRLVDFFIVTTAATAEHLASFGIDPRKIHVVPLTVDAEYWAKGASLSERIANNPKTVLFVGRFIPDKNVDFILQMAHNMKDLTDVQFVCAGDGPLLDRAKRVVSAQGLTNVSFTGFLPQEKVRELYQKSDILLLPSRRELWGAVVNEALAAGIPAMVSEVAGAACLIEHGLNGYRISPDDVGQAEALLRQFFDDSYQVERARMKEAAARIGRALTHSYAARLLADVLGSYRR